MNITFEMSWLTSKESMFDISGFTILVVEETPFPLGISIIFVGVSLMLAMTKMMKGKQ